MKKLFLLSIVFIGLSFCITSLVSAQGVGINPSGNPADPSAGLDVSSTNKGVLIPRLTTVERNAISNPAQALQIFNTTTNCFEVFNGVWQTLICTCTGAPAAPGSISGSTNVCSEQIVTYSISPVAGANYYTWTIPSGATIIAGQGTLSIAVTFGVTGGNINVSATNNCGTSAPGNNLAITVTNTPSTPGSIAGLIYPCVNQAGVSYSISPVSGATSYTWTVPAGSTVVSGQGTTSVTIDFGAISGNITVNANNSCGSSSTSLTVLLNTSVPTDPGVISGPTSSICSGQSVTYSVVPVANTAFYAWTIGSGTITSGLGTNSINAFFSGSTGVLTVTTTNGCGSSAASSQLVSIPSSVFTPLLAYTGEGVPFTPAFVGASSYSWTFPGGSPSTSTSQNPTVSWSSPGTYSVTLMVNGTCSTTQSVVVASQGQLFSYTGSSQTFTVPVGVTSLTLEVTGAGGGKGYNNGNLANGGVGGSVSGNLSVTPGSILYVNVGQKGTDATASVSCCAGGWNGGGAGAYGSPWSGSYDGGGGGGASDVRIGTNAYANVVIVGGAGAGGSFYINSIGGSGGYPSGGTGTINGTVAPTCGRGGTQSAGGAGGLSGTNGSPGTLGTGGNAAINGSCAGGGGGGYYGGGGGADCNGGGGGGGSSYIGGVSNATYINGVQSGNGLVTITW